METEASASDPIVYMTKRMQVSTAHRLYSQQLSEEDNRATFGKCANTHGHNYVVRVTLRGPVNPVTGMLINIVELKRAMEETIMKYMDHKNLDEDVPFFKDKVSTSENITVFVWRQLQQALGEKAGLLHEVSVDETENNTFVYRGE